MPQPNIIYLHSHDTGRYVQPYGHAVPTPNMQRLAEGGVLFRQAFNAAPTCSPSRACLLTGSSAHSCGLLGLVNRGFDMQHPERHLAHTLKAAGYATALFGVTHVHRDLSLLGYDQIVRGGAVDGIYTKAEVTDAAVAFLQNPPAQPFFASIGYFETHRRFPEPGPDDNPDYCIPPAPLPDTPETRYDMAAYKSSARALDTNYGRILDALDEAGLAENTLIINTTDHGLAFPGMKCTLTDHGMGVLLIMRGPGFEGGRSVQGMISQIDLFPTLCDYLAIDPPGWLEGKSFMPLVRGEKKEINDEIFGEVTYHAAYEPKRAVRTQRYKYIRRYDDDETRPMANVDASPSKAYWVDHGYAEQPVPREQLYDLIFDPHESHNLAGDIHAADVLAEMRGRLDGWMVRTNDPLLHGPVPPAEGVVVSPHHHREPGDVEKEHPGVTKPF